MDLAVHRRDGRDDRQRLVARARDAGAVPSRSGRRAAAAGVLDAAGPAGAQAVEAVAERLEAEDRSWGQPDDFVKAAMEVLDAVARCYFPASESPILERPLPHVLGAVELALRDVRHLVADEIPFGASVTLKGWMRLKSLGQWAWPIVVGGYRGYRVARLANPLAGIAREGMDWASRRLAGHSLAKTKHWLIRQAVRGSATTPSSCTAAT